MGLGKQVIQDPNSRSLKKHDPVHDLYRQILRSDLGLDKDHLLLVAHKYLPRDSKLFEHRVLLRAGLFAYWKQIQIERKLNSLEVDTDAFAKLFVTYSRVSDSALKAYRIKGMKTPGKTAKLKKDLKPLDDSAKDQGSDARQETEEAYV